MWPTADELAAFMRTTISDSAAAEQALQLAKSIVQAEVGSPIEETTETWTVQPNRLEIIVLPHFPVVAVGSVTEDGELLVEDDDYSWSEAGLLLRSSLQLWGSPVEVEYTHGFLEIPGFVRAVVLSIAARILHADTATGSVSSETIGNYSVSYATSESSTGFVGEFERRMLSPLRAPSVV